MSSPSQWRLDYVFLPKGSLEDLIGLKVAQLRHADAKFMGVVSESDIDEAALSIACLEEKWASLLHPDMLAAVVVFTQDQADIEFETQKAYNELDQEYDPSRSFSELSLLVEDYGAATNADRSVNNWEYWAGQPGVLPAAIEGIS